MWMVLAMIAAAGGPGAADRADLETMFALMDRNGDGYVTANEAPRITQVRAAAVQAAAVRPGNSWIARYDRDGDGKVSEVEFVDGSLAETL